MSALLPNRRLAPRYTNERVQAPLKMAARELNAEPAYDPPVLTVMLGHAEWMYGSPGTGERQREKQSVQSLPRPQNPYSEPGPPSSQNPSLA